MMNRETMKNEAVKRMHAMHMLDDVVNAFKNENHLFLSERQNSFWQATLYDMTDKEILSKIEEFEKEYSGLVYHVQLTHTTMGDMYSLLYVSDHEEEWQMDWEEIEKEAFAYVINGDIEEFGTIGIKPYMGGIARIW